MDIPWKLVAQSALQTFIVLWFVLLSLKLMGRKVFGEAAPYDLVLILLISEAMNTGMVPQNSGLAGSLASGLTLILTVAFIERCKPLQDWFNAKPVFLFKDGKPDSKLMKQKRLIPEDLEKTAREYGYASIDAFETMVLEEDGSITGILKAPDTNTLRKSKKSS